MRLHPHYRGKLEVTPKCSIQSCDDFAIWYTPGVAAPCRDIAAHPERFLVTPTKEILSRWFRMALGSWDWATSAPTPRCR